VTSTVVGLLLVGIATMYGGPLDSGAHEDRPLYCDMYDGKSHVFEVGAAPWIAVDVAHYESGAVQCGDMFLLLFEDDSVPLRGYSVVVAQSLDAGFLERHWVEDWGPDRRIVVDVPYLFWTQSGLAAPAQAINVSRAMRLLGEEGMEN